MKNKCVTSQDDTHNSLSIFFCCVSWCLIDLKIANDDVDQREQKSTDTICCTTFVELTKLATCIAFFLFVLTHIVLYTQRVYNQILLCSNWKGNSHFQWCCFVVHKCVKSILSMSTSTNIYTTCLE